MSDFDPKAFVEDTEADVQETAVDFDPNAFLGDEAPAQQAKAEPKRKGLIDKTVGAVGDLANAAVDTVRTAGEMAETASNSMIESVGGRAIIPAINASISSLAGGDKFQEEYRFWQNEYDKQRVEEGERDPITNKVAPFLPLAMGGGAVANATTKALGVTSTTIKGAKAAEMSFMGYLKANRAYVAVNAAADGLVASGLKSAQIGAGSASGGPKEVIEDGLANFLLSGTFQTVFKAAGYGVKTAYDSATPNLVKNVVESAGKRMKSGMDEYTEFLRKKGVSDEVITKETAEAFEEIGLTKSAVYSNKAKVEANVKAIKEVEGRKIQEGYDYISRNTANAPVDVTAPIETLQTSILSVKNVDTPEIAQSKQIAAEYLDTMFKKSDGSIKNRNISDTWNTIKNIEDSGLTEIDPGIKRQVVRELRSNLSRYREDFFRAAEGNSRKAAFKAEGIAAKLEDARNSIEATNQSMNNILKQADSIDNPEAREKFVKSVTEEFKLRNQANEALMNSYSKELDQANKLMQDSDPVEILSKATKDAPEGVIKYDKFNANEFAKQKDILIKANQKYNRISTLDEMVISKFNPPSTPGGVIAATIKNAVSSPVKTLATGFVFGKEAAKTVMFTKGTIGGVKQVLSEISGNTIDKVVYDNANKMYNLIDNLQGLQNDTFGARVIASLSKTLSDPSMDDEKTANELAYTAAEVNLYINPIARTTEAAKTRLDDVMTMANRLDPKLSAQLADAIDKTDDEALGSILDQISKNPEMARFFEGGQGWDGRLTSQEDRIQAVQQLKSNIFIPRNKRKEMEASIMQKGIVPDAAQFQRQPMNTTKKKEVY